MLQAVICLMGAMVGAGFASGREVMHFFSQWGAFSWGLILGAAVLTAALIRRGMDRSVLDVHSLPGRALMLLLLTAAGGGMTAAAGELAALTAPLHAARGLGSVITLGVCLAFCQKPLGMLAALGKLLLPALAAALLACLRIPGEAAQTQTVSGEGLALACVQGVGYCGLNIALTAGILRDIAMRRNPGERRWIAALTGAAFGLMLCLGNAALLPHASGLKRAALPVVMLLRNYGKAGYYAAAFVLYLAVISTLLAVLRGMIALLPGKRKRAWAGLITMAASMLGFQELVGSAYPALGLLSMMLMIRQTREKSV